MHAPIFHHAMRRNQRPGARSSNGFALLEVLMALLLFSIGILGLLGLQTRAVITVGDAEDRNRAALIADQCASQMQLQAGNATITGTGPSTAAYLAGICNGWNVSDPTQGGLSNGKITVTPVTPYAVVPGGAPVAPFSVGIQVTWCPPARAGSSAGTCASDALQSKLTTQATLLVLNK